MNYEKYLKYKTKYLDLKEILDGGDDSAKSTSQYDDAKHKSILNRWRKYYFGPENNTILMRIGVMGSGKTSSVDSYIENNLKYNPEIFTLIDLDRIITTSGEMKDEHDWVNANEKIDGYQIVDTLIRESLAKKKTFSTESTGAWVCPSRKIITLANKIGYNTIAIMPFVPFYLLKERVTLRAQKEGRAVKLEELILNLERILTKINDIIPLADEFIIVHNVVDIGKPPKLMLNVKVDYSIKNGDNFKCCNWNSYDNEINYILKLLINNESKYKGEKEENVFRLEKKFITSLLSSNKRPNY